MLEYMLRMRKYRKRATESRVLAAITWESKERARYFAIAQHYADLAITEEQSFKIQLDERFKRASLTRSRPMVLRAGSRLPRAIAS
jgi:RNA-splicing ligase RtcB